MFKHMSVSDWAQLIIKLDEVRRETEDKESIVVSISDIDVFVQNEVKKKNDKIDLDFVKEYNAKKRFEFKGFKWCDNLKDGQEVDFNGVSDYIGYIIECIAQEEIC